MLGIGQIVGKYPPQMIGSAGRMARMAFDTAAAVGICGPPITVTPTASMPCVNGSACSGDKVPIDVAVNNGRVVGTLDSIRQAQHRQGKAGMPRLGDGRIDQQNRRRALMTASAAICRASSPPSQPATGTHRARSGSAPGAAAVHWRACAASRRVPGKI